MDKYAVLKDYFGYTEFRNGQEQIIDNILSGRDVVAVMPTGVGKSLCYQIPALMLEGLTLVISPLISLMKDQIRSLIDMGIKAAFINSTLTYKQQRIALERASQGAYKIIYVAPERLSSPEFADFAASNEISLVAVDEAHCISQWGQDFRPGYLRISEFIDKMIKRPVVGAFTATATQAVKEDIISSLRLIDPYSLTTGFDRENLYFEVLKPKNKQDALKSILERLEGKSGIIYCSTRKNVEEICKFLNELGHPATRYHAGLPAEERVKNQNDFIYDIKTVMVATNAFGMGIDKSNVSYVVHYNMPKDMESYYQEAGRAGRDGSPAECILLYSGQDVRINRLLIQESGNKEETTEQERARIISAANERLKKMTLYCSITGCQREYILNYFGDSLRGYCGNCGNCNTNYESRDITQEARKIISCVGRLARLNRQFGKTVIADILRGSKAEKLMKLKLDKLSTYGIMADSAKQTVISVMDHLIENEYLELTELEYPTVVLGARYSDALRENARLEMMLPKEVRLEKAYTLSARGRDSLFEVLRARRAKLAFERKIPAFMVFSDATLIDMCKRLPRSIEEFGNVKGVGTMKLQSYGEVFIDAIKSYSERNSQAHNTERFTAGTRIFHKSFGPGEIMSVSGNIAEIRFDGFSEPKKLNIDMCVQKELIQTAGSVHDKSAAGGIPAESVRTIVTEKPRGRNEFASVIYATTGNRASAQAIAYWLANNGYLTLGEKYKVQEITPEGYSIGISIEKRRHENGEEYEQVMLGPAAQKAILEHFEEMMYIWAKRQ